jgi:hypothetical protein
VFYRPELKGTGLGIGKSSGFMYENYEAPPSVDWRKKGAVSEVKNQQQVRCPSHTFFKKPGNPILLASKFCCFPISTA